jgi:Ni/Fe-hydrogenase subunit HybB-like protein
MTEHIHVAPAPVGGRLLTPLTLTCVAILVGALPVRPGRVTALNDGYPWGIWVVVDVVIGSAFACGGFSVAMLVYIFNKGEYHPLVRPALLASLFGYTLAGAGVIFDLGRWWNVWHMFWPWSINPNSVMFEVAVCISLYIIVMWIEFSPVVLEKLGKDEAQAQGRPAMFFIIALGTVLPMMHQSSLGTLLVVLGVQIHPLWQTPLQPLALPADGDHHGLRGGAVRVLPDLDRLPAQDRNPPADAAGEDHARLPRRVSGGARRRPVVRGALPKAFVPSVEALCFWIEMLSIIAPLILIGAESNRRNPARLFLAGVLLMLGGAMLRLNGFLIGYETTVDMANGFSYFPTLAEVLVTAGMFALEVLGYIVITRRFPVLPREAATH